MAKLQARSLSVSYRHTQSLTQRDRDVAQRWHYEVTGRDERGGEVPVGLGEAILIDLYGSDPYGSLDPFDEHIHRIRDVVMDSKTRDLDKTWGDDLQMMGDRLLVLDDLRLDESAGARGLSPSIRAMVVSQLGHCTVATVYAPREPQAWDELADLRAAGLDFKPIRDGVHYLDTSLVY